MIALLRAALAWLARRRPPEQVEQYAIVSLRDPATGERVSVPYRYRATRRRP